MENLGAVVVAGLVFMHTWNDTEKDFRRWEKNGRLLSGTKLVGSMGAEMVVLGMMQVVWDDDECRDGWQVESVRAKMDEEMRRT